MAEKLTYEKLVSKQWCTPKGLARAPGVRRRLTLLH